MVHLPYVQLPYVQLPLSRIPHAPNLTTLFVFISFTLRMFLNAHSCSGSTLILDENGFKVFLIVMSLHFRRLVGMIIIEYISQLNKKNIEEIDLFEFEKFLTSCLKPRATIANLVRDLLTILCGRCDVDDAASNLIAMWIRRKKPLSSVSKLYKWNF